MILGRMASRGSASDLGELSPILSGRVPFPDHEAGVTK